MAVTGNQDQSAVPRVFVSYAHDSDGHRRQVLRLCVLLRELGVDARVDEWDSGLRRDWYAWMIEQFTRADHVIVVASPRYRTAADGDAPAECHRGVQTESSILRDFLHGDRAVWTRKILPVILPGRSAAEIPLYLQPTSTSHYHLPDISPDGVAELLAVIQNRPRHVLPALGEGWSAAPSVISTLPRDVVGFTGRDRELTELVGRIDLALERGDAAIHVVNGMPGVGKTAFAVHAAHQVAARFPGGHLFLELRGHTPGQRPVTPLDALGSLLLAVGVEPRHVPAGLDDRARLWRDRLAGRELLLLLDDVGGHEQVRPLLPGTPGCQVLITSRHRLAGLEDAQPLPLGVLPAQQAVAMFLRLARREADGNEQDLMRLCGHLPLAIGLAAGRLRSHPTWDVRYLTAQLVSTRNRLAEIRVDDRSVVAAFAASYRDLPPDVRRLFRRLGRHPGIDFDLHTTVALGGAATDAEPVEDTRRRLETLYLNHLVEESARGRYRLHDLIRHFARTRFDAERDEDGDAVVERVLDYYVHVATSAARLLPHHDRVLDPTGPPPAHTPVLDCAADALRWFAAERLNLSSCVDYARRHDRPWHTIRLAAALHPYLARKGHWDDALAIHAVACRAAERVGDDLGLAVSRRNRGSVQRLMEHYPAAMANLVRAHKLFADLGDLSGAADAIQSIGAVQCATGDYADATANLTAVLTLCTETGNRFGAAMARYRLGIVAHLTNDYGAAASALARAYTMFAEVGSRHGEAEVLSYLGLVQGRSGDHSPALRCLVQAVAVFEEVGDRRGLATALCRLGYLLRILGRHQEAVRTGERAHALFVDLGSCHGQANTLCDLAMARYLGGERTPGDHNEAVGTLEEALALCDPLFEATVHNYLGVLQHLAGECHAATERLTHALDLCADTRDLNGRAETLNNLGTLAWDWPEAGDAFSHHQQALEVARDIGAQLEQARALEGMGRCLVRDCHVGNGHAHLREALTLYQRLSVPQAKDVRALLAALG